MLGLVRHAQTCRIFSRITKCQYLWEGLSYFVSLLHVVRHLWKLQCYRAILVGYGPACPKFSEITNRQYLWKGFSDFVDFLHAVVCILLGIHWSYKKMLLWVDTVRYRIPANQIVRCFKLNEVPSWLSANHWSYEKYAILSYGPNNFLANQFAEFSTFDLFDLLILKVIANSWFWT